MTRTKPSKSRYKRPARAKALIPLLDQEPDPLRKKLLLLGYVTDRLEKESESVFLVGGQAVETYTAGQFTTGDVDITTTDAKKTMKILANIGFKRIGMIWLSERLGLAVHIVGMSPPNPEKTRTIEVGPYNVRLVGVEDLILDRLAAAKFWNSTRDMEQAKALYSNFLEQIDSDYLKTKAKEKNVADALRQTILGRVIGADKGRVKPFTEDDRGQDR
ncbi:UbiD family decarboxylase [Candidatus Bathyarchaeota archaeon]|nr:UbiD family decarboxylase [Candidatus Bathyarchaeota archaeon]